MRLIECVHSTGNFVVERHPQSQFLTFCSNRLALLCVREAPIDLLMQIAQVSSYWNKVSPGNEVFIIPLAKTTLRLHLDDAAPEQ